MTASNWIVCYTQQFNFDSCKIELYEIELFDHLTVRIYKMCLQILYLMYM